jgi:hypothetical protein
MTFRHLRILLHSLIGLLLLVVYGMLLYHEDKLPFFHRGSLATPMVEKNAMGERIGLSERLGLASAELQGHFYDLKQTPDRRPSDVGVAPRNIKSDNDAEVAVMSRFFSNGWDEAVLKNYYKAKDTLRAPQIWIPNMKADDGPKSFGVEKEVPVASHWVIHYKGTVVAPKDGTFRFVGIADDLMGVRFDNRLVFGQCWFKYYEEQLFGTEFLKSTGQNEDIGLPTKGAWFTVKKGESYPIEILIGEMPGNLSQFKLMIEDQNPEQPSPHRTEPGQKKYPVFQVRKGAPLTPDQNAEVMPEPIVFQAK